MQITLTTGRWKNTVAKVLSESEKSIKAHLPDGSTIVLPKQSRLNIRYYVEAQR